MLALPRAFGATIGDTWAMDMPISPAGDADRDLDLHLADVVAAPRLEGRIASIIRRPAHDEREVVAEGVLDVAEGLVGDGWLTRGSKATPDGSADPESQLTLMSTRVLAAIEPDASRWPLAGDQILVDMDLSVENLPPGTRLVAGGAELEVAVRQHTGCAKFAARFGTDALRWISTPDGKALRMRGVYVKVVRGGTVRVGQSVRKI